MDPKRQTQEVTVDTSYQDQVLDLSKPKRSPSPESDVEKKSEPEICSYQISLEHVQNCGSQIGKDQAAIVTVLGRCLPVVNIVTGNVLQSPWVVANAAGVHTKSAPETTENNNIVVKSPCSSTNSEKLSRKPSTDETQQSWTCPQKGCGETFKCSRLLRHHVEGCDVDRNYKCPCCKEKFKTLTIFLEHVRSHDFLKSTVQARRQVSRRAVHCPVDGCPTSVTRVTDLTPHLKKCHSKKSDVQ